jgi:DNA-binding MarR family transcriptional regulator
MARHSNPPDRSPAAALATSPAFLLTKLGAESSRLYKQRLQPLGLEPHHARSLRYIASADGLSQQALADQLGLARSRIVVLVDELEQLNLVKRRRSATDRRAHALHLTTKGEKLLGQVMDASRDHENDLCAPLDPNERAQLTTLLQRLATRPSAPLETPPDLNDQGTTAGTARRARRAA